MKSEHDLRECVKELTCLYNISRLIEDVEISIEQFFIKLLTIVPPAWQFPEVTYRNFMIFLNSALIYVIAELSC